jgi:hypothetical protein
MLGLKEGWQDQTAGRVFHYIRETMALCRGYGFYTGELVPDVENRPRDNAECAKCFRLLRNEQRRKAKADAKSGASTG